MKQVYMCEYCGHMGDGKEVMEHEDSCDKNPKNKKCKSCMYCSLPGWSATVGYKSTEIINCAYREQPNALNIKNVDGNGCEHWAQGETHKIVPN